MTLKKSLLICCTLLLVQMANLNAFPSAQMTELLELVYQKELGAIKKIYAQQGKHTPGQPTSTMAKGIIQKASDLAGAALRNVEDRTGYNQDGYLIIIESAYSRNLIALNVAYYASIMLESIEDKLATVAWSDHKATSDDEWLASMEDVIRSIGFKKAQSLMVIHWATEQEVRQLLKTCAQKDLELSALEELARKNYPTVVGKSIASGALAAMISGIGIYKLIRTSTAHPDEIAVPTFVGMMAGALTGSITAAIVYFNTATGRALVNKRAELNAIRQIIVERFVNDTPF